MPWLPPLTTYRRTQRATRALAAQPVVPLSAYRTAVLARAEAAARLASAGIVVL